MLVHLGYETSAIASSADEALARAEERRPDVVLMDIRLKGPRDGIETAAILQARFGLPVVYLTAYADEITLERAMTSGPYGFLVKPVKLRELRSAIELAVYRHRVERKLREHERWFSTTLRCLRDAVICADVDGRITCLNPAAESLTGAESFAAIGEPLESVLALAGDALPVSTALLDREVLHGRANLRDRATGLLRAISLRAAPVLVGEETLGSVIVFRDLDERS